MAERERKEIRQVPYSIDIKIPGLTIENALALNLPRHIKNNVIRGVIGRLMETRPENVLDWSDSWGESWGDSWGQAMTIPEQGGTILS